MMGRSNVLSEELEVLNDKAGELERTITDNVANLPNSTFK